MMTKEGLEIIYNNSWLKRKITKCPKCGKIHYRIKYDVLYISCASSYCNTMFNVKTGRLLEEK